MALKSGQSLARQKETLTQDTIRLDDLMLIKHDMNVAYRSTSPDVDSFKSTQVLCSNQNVGFAKEQFRLRHAHKQPVFLR